MKITHDSEEFLCNNKGLRCSKKTHSIKFAGLEIWEIVLQPHVFKLPDVSTKKTTKHSEVLFLISSKFPLVYALLWNRKINKFQTIQTLNSIPLCITIDFEITGRNAMKQTSSDVDILFCFFHLSIFTVELNNQKKK